MPRTPSLFPDPVCRHPDEYGLVAAVLAAPLDDLPKLVYADWLDDRGDPRGAFVRKWLAARQARKKLPKPDKGVSKCWLGLLGYELDLFIEKQSHPAWGEAVRATALPGLMARTVPLKDGETVPPGGSKVGGLPDLDQEEPWVGGENSLAAFVAQWNLAELAVSPACAKLPKKGLLSFFIDLVPFVEDSGDGMSRAIYNRDATTAEEREPDDDLAEENEIPACRVEFREWLFLPDYRSPALVKRMTNDQRHDYAMPFYDYPLPKGSHTILGHAGPIQSYPAPDGRKEWALLTEFGPDPAARLEACDGGRWYFMLPASDLRKGKFDGVEMEFQTG